MSDEQNKTPSPAGQNGNFHKHSHHRNRHGHPNPNRAQNANSQLENRQQQPVQQQNQNGNNPTAGNRENGNARRNRNRHHHKGNRPAGENYNQNRMITDPYGIPSPQDQKILDDIRAKIVLRSADGSVPAQKVAESPKKEQPVKKDLLEDLTPAFAPFNEKVNEKKYEEVEVANLSSEELFSNPSVTVSPSDKEECVEVVGIRFRASGKIYDFDPCGQKLTFEDFAIVETARGQEFGKVVNGNHKVSKKDTVAPLRPVIRVATKEDVLQNEENRKKEDEAIGICQKKILEHKLEMNLVDAQYAFDRSKLIFYFTAENRVDFRELVRDLASIFHTRIDLRQIGIRDEAKMLGGLGACGRALCCSSFLSDFMQVTIKMAKEQGLSLNSSKISGACGRLMCCLRYESDVYAEEIKLTPSQDSIVKTPDGTGKVIGSNPLAGTVRVLFNDGQDTSVKQYAREEVTVIEQGKKSTEPTKNDSK